MSSTSETKAVCSISSLSLVVLTAVYYLFTGDLILVPTVAVMTAFILAVVARKRAEQPKALVVTSLITSGVAACALIIAVGVVSMFAGSPG